MQNSKIKCCYNAKPSTYSFYVKKKIYVGFQNCISAPLSKYQDKTADQPEISATELYVLSLLSFTYFWEKVRLVSLIKHFLIKRRVNFNLNTDRSSLLANKTMRFALELYV